MEIFLEIFLVVAILATVVSLVGIGIALLRLFRDIITIVPDDSMGEETGRWVEPIEPNESEDKI